MADLSVTTRPALIIESELATHYMFVRLLIESNIPVMQTMGAKRLVVIVPENTNADELAASIKERLEAFASTLH